MPSDPKPISDFLRGKLDQAVKDIPAPKQGRANVGVSLKGVEVSFAQRVKEIFTLSAYAAREWGGGWSAGANASILW